jgi:hypothetical protein
VTYVYDVGLCHLEEEANRFREHVRKEKARIVERETTTATFSHYVPARVLFVVVL